MATTYNPRIVLNSGSEVVAHLPETTDLGIEVKLHRHHSGNVSRLGWVGYGHQRGTTPGTDFSLDGAFALEFQRDTKGTPRTHFQQRPLLKAQSIYALLGKIAARLDARGLEDF